MLHSPTFTLVTLAFASLASGNLDNACPNSSPVLQPCVIGDQGPTGYPQCPNPNDIPGPEPCVIGASPGQPAQGCPPCPSPPIELCVVGASSGPNIFGYPPCPPNIAPPPALPRWSPKAIYFMTNDAKANSIMALPVLGGGGLDYGTTIATGGAGGAEVDPITRAPIAPGSLASQGSVRVAAGMVFAVNAGSNTLSMLAVNATDPTKLTLVGAPVDTLGEFPVTLAVSANKSLVCVGNTGAKAGIACSRFTSAGLGPMDILRPFPLNQTTPPTGPFNTVSETFFNEAETALHTTVKGGRLAGEFGFLSTFSVINDGLSTSETRSVPSSLAHLCGTASVPGTDNLLVADLLLGARFLGVDKSNQVSEHPVPGWYYNQTSCWVTVSNALGTAFLTDASVNHLVEIDLTNGTVVQVEPVMNDYPGMTDIIGVGTNLYALAPGNETRPPGVVNFDVSGDRLHVRVIQLTRPANLTASISGLAAFWPPNV